MKTKFIFIYCIIAFAIAIIPQKSFSIPERNTCLCNYWEGYNSIFKPKYKKRDFNPDSVMIDTCKASATYAQTFAFKGASIQFKNINPFKNKKFEFNKYYNLADLDSSSYPLLFKQFLDLKDKFGNFTIQAFSDQQTYQVATDRFISFLSLNLTFDNYVQVDLVKMKLKEITPQVNSTFEVRIRHLNSITSEPPTIDQYISLYGKTLYFREPLLNKLRIYDSMGRELYYDIENKNTFSMESFESGAYYIHLESNNETYVQHILLIK